MKTVGNKWIKDVVAEGIEKEREITILGLDDNDTLSHEELEAGEYWDDLSGKALDSRLVNKARAAEMRE